MHLSALSLALNRPGGLSLWGQAVVNLDLAAMSSLPASWTFERASTATYVDAVGRLKTAQSGEARFTHHPYLLTPLGYLTEEQRTNLLLHSQDITEAAWTASSASTTAGLSGAPTDTSVACSLIEDNNNAVHSVSQAVTNSATTAFTGSVWLKANGRTWARVQLDFDTQYRRVWVNLSTATLGTEEGTATQVAPARLERYQNGWVRVWLSASSASGATRGLTVATATGDQVTSYAGDGASGLFVFGAQLENAGSVSSYIATTTTDVTREADFAYWDKGSAFATDRATLFAESVSHDGHNAGFTLSPVTISNADASDALSLERYDVDGNYALGSGMAMLNDDVFRAFMGGDGTAPAFAPVRAVTRFFVAGSLRVSVNGVAGTPEIIDGSSWSVNEVWLGLQPWGNTSSHNGTIARVGVWARELTDVEIASLMESKDWILSRLTWDDGSLWLDSATWEG